MSDLAEFLADFRQQVDVVRADGSFGADAFFECFTEEIMEAAGLETADRAHYAARGVLVDGSGGDPSEAGNVLTLIACDHNGDDEVRTLTRTDLDATFRRLREFIARARDAAFRNALEETSPAFGLAEMIATRWASLERVQLFVLSDRKLSARVDVIDSDEIDRVEVVHHVWDLDRLRRLVESGRPNEDIVLDLSDETGAGSIDLLPAHLETAAYEAYLVAFPAERLARIYDQHRERLLERNIRVFLQGRTAVNKGIRLTLENQPEMFFAYNNGVTATAEAVEKRDDGGRTVLARLTNLQIVNGGQTTASIHRAWREGVDISRVFVQMKLSVVDAAIADTVVPRISEFANSQNRIAAADFESNAAFHVRMEKISRRLLAPAGDGAVSQTKWFYERSRGQFQGARPSKTGAERRRFDLEYPRSQLITKTDLAKFVTLWDTEHAHLVNGGAQRNFMQFAVRINEAWEQDSDRFNDFWFRDMVAKAIIFRFTERMVQKQPWYGGYRANIVAYTIAKLAHDSKERGLVVDFDAIWRRQEVTPGVAEALTVASRSVFEDVLASPPPSFRNISEWAKKPQCWERVRELRLGWPAALEDELIAPDRRDAEREVATKDQRRESGAEAQEAVIMSERSIWADLSEWGLRNDLISDEERGALATCANAPLPDERSCEIAVEVLRRLSPEGFGSGADVLALVG